MDLKEEFDFLIKTIKTEALKKGEKLKNKDIADKIGYNPVYFNSLAGKSGRVTRDHVETLKAIYEKELVGIGRPTPGDPLNPERAILLALLEDYVEWKAEETGTTFDDVKAALVKRGKRKLEGLDSWLPGE